MIFNSVEQALKFAGNISDRSEYAKSDPLRVRSTSTAELSPLELHAQAAMIHMAVERLHSVERDSIVAMYGRGKARTDAMRNLSGYLMPLVDLPTREDVMIVVCHWSTRRPSIRAIADDRGVSYRKVCSWRTTVLRAWLPIQARAIARLHDAFTESGLLPS